MSVELHTFQYHLENNLYKLFQDLSYGNYHHGNYRKFVVNDNKRREISVASIRDRVVHRLLYDYLVPIWDKTFIYDVWSCRKGKGLLGAIERTQQFLKSWPCSFIWRADIQKFFDNVDHDILLKNLARRTSNLKAMDLLSKVINSFNLSQKSLVDEGGKGIPIGNLTSQIFANIYLNELDRFVQQQLKPKSYLRYGDDFLIFETDQEKLQDMRIFTTEFFSSELKLNLHARNNLLIKARQGLKFLGVELWPTGRRLSKRNKNRIASRLSLRNSASYHGLISKHSSEKMRKWLNWRVHELIFTDSENMENY